MLVFFYIPGLIGEFVLDDYGNLPPLFDAIKSHGFWYGVFSGTSGPLGRPLTLFTFALQSNFWPNPYYFKCINLVIHVINATLIFCLVRLLSSYFLSSLKSQYYNFFALFVAVTWAVLPIHVSTVLYVVQRMVLLSTFFILAGIICYVVARVFLDEKRYILSLVFFFHTLLFALLAVLSKESGLLIFAYLLCVEQIIKIKKPIANSSYKLIINICLIAPLVFFVIYLFHLKFYNGYLVRPFSLSERLLTESRVLWIYIHQIIFPKPSDLGLYHDAFNVSRGFLEPLSTLFACVGWFFVVAGVIWSLLKKKVHIFFPCLWFFSGHLMESTVIPLEIYFEHRNYLASLGVVLGIAFLFLAMFKIVDNKILKLMFVIFVGSYLVVLASILMMQTKLWGNPLLFKYVHATERFNSIRARALLVDFYQEQGKNREAYNALESIEKDFPNEPALYFLKLQFLCVYSGWTDTINLDLYAKVLQQGEFSNGALKAVDDLVSFKDQNKCQSVSYYLMFKSLMLFKSNKNYAHKYHYIARYESKLYLQLNDINGAINALGSINYRGYEDSISYARLLASMRRFDEALVAVDVAKRNLGAGVIKYQQEAELNELEMFIHDDIKNSK